MLTRRRQQRCQDVAQGTGLLTEDLWGMIFSHLSLGDVSHCLLVCRAWRDIGKEVMDRIFILKPRRSSSFVSHKIYKDLTATPRLLRQWIGDRGEMLRVLVLLLPYHMAEMQGSVVRAMQKCQRLVVCDFAMDGLSQFKIPDVERPAPTLKIFQIHPSHYRDTVKLGSSMAERAADLMVLELSLRQFSTASQVGQFCNLRALQLAACRVSQISAFLPTLRKLKFLSLCAPDYMYPILPPQPERSTECLLQLPSLARLHLEKVNEDELNWAKLGLHLSLKMASIEIANAARPLCKSLIELPQLFRLSIWWPKLQATRSLMEFISPSRDRSVPGQSKVKHLALMQAPDLQVDLANISIGDCLESLSISSRQICLKKEAPLNDPGLCSIILISQNAFSEEDVRALESDGFQVSNKQGTADIYGDIHGMYYQGKAKFSSNLQGASSCTCDSKPHDLDEALIAHTWPDIEESCFELQDTPYLQYLDTLSVPWVS